MKASTRSNWFSIRRGSWVDIEWTGRIFMAHCKHLVGVFQLGQWSVVCV